MDERSAESIQSLIERRKYHRVREVFDQAYVLIEPFFSSENRWGGQTLDHLAYRILRDHFPGLTGEETFILVGAAKRVYAERDTSTEGPS
jgi:hypothetical protein